MASKTELLWWVIPGVLAGSRVPRIDPRRLEDPALPLEAGRDDLPLLHAAGIRAVVSLLEAAADPRVFAQTGFAFLSLPIATGDSPSRAQTMQFVRFVNEQRARKHPVAVHGQGGPSRTGTLMAGYLITEGEDAVTAIVRVRTAQPNAIATARQVEFLERFARFCRRWV